MALLSTDVNAYLTSYGFNPATISAENKSIINKILAGATTGAYSVAMSELNREMERRRAMSAGTATGTGTTNPDVLVSDAIADSDKAAKAKRTRNIILIVVGALVLIGGVVTTVVLIRRNRNKRQRNG